MGLAWLHPSGAQSRHALLIGGLGGSPEYSEAIQQYLFDARTAFVGPLGFDASNVTVLAEPALAEAAAVDGVANADNIRTAFADLASSLTEDDQVFVMLFGHGSFDGQDAMLNIARRDLSSADYRMLVDALPTDHVVFVNTASASGPFVDALSAPGRIVITATRSGTQRNQTVYPRFLVEALGGPQGDLDRDGSLSVLEAHNYAALRVLQHFEDGGHLPTEHALIDDNGDFEGTRVEALRDGQDGHLAAVTFLRRPSLAVASGPMLQMQGDKEAIERQVAALKSRKSAMNVDAYYNELEVLMVRLARLNLAMDQEL